MTKVCIATMANSLESRSPLLDHTFVYSKNSRDCQYIQSLNEIIIDGKTGLLFECGDEKQLYGKTKLVYTDKKLKRKMVENRLKNNEKYSLRNYLIKLKAFGEVM